MTRSRARPIRRRHAVGALAASLALAAVLRKAGHEVRLERSATIDGSALGDVDVATLVEAIPHIVWMANSEGVGDYLNSRALELTGMSRETLSGSGWLDVVHPSDRECTATEWAEAVASGQPYEAEYRVRDCDGRYRRMLARALPIRSESGAPIRWIGTWTDVEDDRLLRDQLESAERQALEALALADAFQASAPLAFGFIDTDFRLVRVNETLAQLNGLSPEHDLGRTVADVVPERWPLFEPHYRSVLENGEAVTVVETVRHDLDGRETSWFSKYFPVRVDEEIVGIGIVGADITETKQAERFRSVVMDTMAEGLYALDRRGKITFMNGSASKMLGWTQDELRGQPAHQAFHYRHGDGTPYPAEDCPLLKVRTEGRVIKVNEDSFILKDGTTLPVAYSASPLRNSSDEVDGVVVVFRDTIAESSERQRARGELNALSWLGRIRDALDEDRLALYSQPIVPLTGGPASEELLVRLITPSGEVVQPGAFLPIAERYGLVADIDRWVITKAIKRAATGRRVEANISAWTIANADLIPMIERLLDETKADPSNLVFEITETALMQDIEAGRSFARALHHLGCGLALDDFGTGFASFTYLKTLPVKYLKIDIEFVRDLANSTANRHVVDAIVSLARGFGQQTIAEGVEDQATIDILREHGIDYVQGFHLGRPAPISADENNLLHLPEPDSPSIR
jgi:PAS domain S-box-containing protein